MALTCRACFFLGPRRSGGDCAARRQALWAPGLAGGDLGAARSESRRGSRSGHRAPAGGHRAASAAAARLVPPRCGCGCGLAALGARLVRPPRGCSAGVCIQAAGRPGKCHPASWSLLGGVPGATGDVLGHAPESSAGHRHGAAVLLWVHETRNRRHHHGRQDQPLGPVACGVSVPVPAPPRLPGSHACSTSCN